MTHSVSMELIRKSLIESGLAHSEEIRGCTETEVEQLQTRLAVRFPKVYRDFLLQMGYSAGRLFIGSDVFYPRTGNLRTWADEMLRESECHLTPPEDAVFFLAHQGYVFFFFRTSEGDDPPVYRILEGEEKPQKMKDHLSVFLLDSVNNYVGMSNNRKSYLLLHPKHTKESRDEGGQFKQQK